MTSAALSALAPADGLNQSQATTPAQIAASVEALAKAAAAPQHSSEPHGTTNPGAHLQPIMGGNR